MNIVIFNNLIIDKFLVKNKNFKINYPNYNFKFIITIIIKFYKPNLNNIFKCMEFGEE